MRTLREMKEETDALLAHNAADLNTALASGAQILEGEMAVKAGTQAPCTSQKVNAVMQILDVSLVFSA